MTSRLVRFLRYCLCAGLLAGTAGAGDPEWFGLIPSNSTVIGLNVERMKASELGQKIFPAVVDLSMGAGAATIRAEKAILGGTREIVFAGPVIDRSSRFLIVLSGSFEPGDLETIAKANSLSKAEVQNVTVFSDRRGYSVALLYGLWIIAGDPQTVQDGIARRGPENDLDTVLAAKVRALRSSHDLWLFSNASLAELGRLVAEAQFGGALRGDLLQSIREVSGGVTFGPKLLADFEVVTRDEKDAIALAGALRTTHLRDADLIEPLLQSLDLKVDGNTVKIGLAIPEAELLKLFEPAAKAPPTRTDVVIQTSPEDSKAKAPPSSGDTTVVTLPGP